MTNRPDARQRLVLVTGPSGAGRSTTINALEDLGYEAIDNLPLSLAPRLLDAPAGDKPLALGIDARNRDFSPERLSDLRARLRDDAAFQAELLYLDCSREILVRRFSETRRRHPLAPADSVIEGIARELILMEPLRQSADTLIDTSDLTPHELRDQIQRLFGTETGQGLAVSVQSFSYKRGLPQSADLVFDCRFLSNPHWHPDLRGCTGRDAQVAEFVRADARFDGFMDRVTALVLFQLPASAEEGKAHFSVAVGCTGGQHRSVAVAEALAKALADQDWRVSIRHRELERKGLSGPGRQGSVADGKDRT